MSDDFLYVDLVGDRNLVRNLDQLPDVVRQILGEKVKHWSEKLADKVREKIEARLARKSGKLEDSVKVEITESKTKVDGRVYIAGVRYAQAQEEGVTTPPHMIFSTKGKVLAFIAASGDKIFATAVFHPGGTIPAHYFMKDAYREMGPEISKGVKKSVIDGIRAKMREGA